MNRHSAIALGLSFFLLPPALAIADEAEGPFPLPPVSIAPLNEALTFARTAYAGAPTLMAVTSHGSSTVSGVLLSHLPDDPIAAYNQLGYRALIDTIEQANVEVTLSTRDLLLPVELADRHVAVGTNFPEHADESNVEDGPFLFTKAVAPSLFDSPVAAAGRLLDYEVELCFVGLEAIDPSAPPAEIGLLLCNDFTDRAALLRHLDPFDVVSGNGFTIGKSAPGFLPIGSLFVIPANRESFVPAIELSLFVNGELKQHAFQRQAIWDLDEILKQTDQRRDAVWQFEGASISLPLEDSNLAARAAILGGTPSGVLFQGPSAFHFVRGFLSWLAGGWDRSPIYWILEAYIEDASADKVFLQPGDLVVAHSPYLGVLENHVVD